MSKCCLKSKRWPCFLENQNCQKNKNKNWTCIHELKCLYVFKQIEKNGFNKNRFENLVEELVQDNIFSNIGKEKSPEGSCEYSIKQKIGNINSLSQKKIKEIRIQEKASKTTREIFERCKNWNIEELGKEIKNLEKNTH